VTESGSTCLGSFIVAPERMVTMYDELVGTLLARATYTAVVAYSSHREHTPAY
jgi:hypothetical protein